MRLTAMDRPGSILLELLYRRSKNQYSKVWSAMNVIYARSRPLLFASMKFIFSANNLALSKPTGILISYVTSPLDPFRCGAPAMRYPAHPKSYQWKFGKRDL